MDFNTIFFGAIIFVSLAIFFYLGKFKASSKQRNREPGRRRVSLEISDHYYLWVGRGGGVLPRGSILNLLLRIFF